MVDTTQRTGKIWNGKFQVEFIEVQSGGSKAERLAERRSAELSFALHTESAEIALVTNADGETYGFPFGKVGAVELSEESVGTIAVSAVRIRPEFSGVSITP